VDKNSNAFVASGSFSFAHVAEEESMGKKPSRMAIFGAVFVLIAAACAPAATTAPTSGPQATTPPAATPAATTGAVTPTAAPPAALNLPTVPTDPTRYRRYDGKMPFAGKKVWPGSRFPLTIGLTSDGDHISPAGPW
jgi:hypothetical protein